MNDQNKNLETIRKLAVDWIHYWQIASNPELNTRTFRKQIERGEHPLSYVLSQEAELMNKDPEGAWQLILELIPKAENEGILALIAAGPLEDLLNRYPDNFKERVDEMARKDALFRKCLAMVWR